MKAQVVEKVSSIFPPVTAPLVVAYGMVDYVFGLSEFIDSRSDEINTGIYEK